MNGKRMRSARKKLDLSLKELATATGLSIGYLSMLERNVKDPSIAALRRIAKALRCSEMWLLVDQDTVEDHGNLSMHAKKKKPKESYIVHADEKLLVTIPEEKTKYEIFTPRKLPHDAQVRMTGMLVTIEANEWVSEKMIYHSYYDESIHIIQGHMDLYIDDEHFELKEGDSAYIPENSLHNYLNIGTGPLVVAVHFSSVVY